jgi:hypothetical protein
LELCLNKEEITISDIKALRIYNSPNLTNISFPINDWGHLEEIVIDEFSLPGECTEKGVFDDVNKEWTTFPSYNPPIWGTLLGNIRDICTATGSKLRILTLDSLVSVENYVLFDAINGKASCPSLEEVSFKKLKSAGNSFLRGGNFDTVYLPSLKEVGDKLLYWCLKIASADLPKLKIAGNYLLAGNSGFLTRVRIGRWNTTYTEFSAGTNLLYNCPNLTSLTFCTTVDTLGANVCGGTTPGLSVNLGITKIEYININLYLADMTSANKSSILNLTNYGTWQGTRITITAHA